MSSVGVYEYSSVNHHQSYDMKPMSKTMQYRKVMKPLLERKRRARINKCLDELKDLMIAALAMDEENIAKLEKADILEITVGHLQKMKRQKQLASNPIVEADRFRSGYTTCAKEVSRVLASTPEVDIQLGTQLMTHLGHQLNEIDTLSRKNQFSQQTQVPHVSSPLMINVGPPSDLSEDAYQRGYPMPLTPPSSRGSPSPVNVVDCDTGSSKVWRPW